MKPVKIVLCFLLLAGGASLAISGQVKVRGEIAGVVVEDKGEGLPGVEVVLTGTVLQQASLTTVSDAKGNFRFNDLLPGQYDLAFKLQGFNAVTQRGVEVFVGRTTPLRVVLMPGKIEQTVVVQATSPMIEVKTPQRTTNFSREILQTLPSNRQIHDIINLAAGFFDNSALGTGGVTPQTTFWQGASTIAYRFNGVDVSDTRRGVTANAPVYETIDEIEVVTVGASAEYGNFTGATINVVTKSGGPQYHGSLNAFYTSSKWRGDNNDLGVDYLPTTIKYDFDVNATVSGPILKDRLYFFLAGGYWGLKNQSYGATTYNTYAQPKYYLKLDWLMNKSNTVSFALNGNPAKNRLLDPGTGQPLTNGGDYLLEFNSLFASWQSVFGSNAFLEVRYAGFLQNYKDWPAFPKDVPYLFDLVSGVNYGYRYMIDRDATRHEVDLNVRYYFDAFASSAHEFVLGLEYENAYDKEDSMRPGGAWLWRLRSPAETWQVRVGDTHTKVTVRRVAAFVQDNFKVGKRLSVNLGLRYDRPLLKALRFAGTFATLDSLSPRLGVSYDLTGDTKTVVRASFGTYHNKVLTQSFTYGLPGKEDEYNYRLYLPGVTI
ncbi:MAG: hypothetical protein FJY80_10270, partial [Candidatus Aminicenantes bacterium]|nr:hypothetical protein [Candidatus Aminicenantes bacterium]